MGAVLGIMQASLMRVLMRIVRGHSNRREVPSNNERDSILMNTKTDVRPGHVCLPPSIDQIGARLSTWHED